MTQKFHENETATIALYKYHDFLKCESALESMKRSFIESDMVEIEGKFINGSYSASDITYAVAVFSTLRRILLRGQ